MLRSQNGLKISVKVTENESTLSVSFTKRIKKLNNKLTENELTLSVSCTKSIENKRQINREMEMEMEGSNAQCFV